MAIAGHSTRSVSQEIERTGLFRAPLPTVPGRRSLRADPIQLLVSATSSEEVLRAAVGYFTGIFKEVVALGVHKGRAMVLMAGSRGGLRAIPQAPQLPLSDGTLVRAVLDRPQVAYRPIADASLAVLCSAVGIAPSRLTLIPAFDYGRPAFIVVGQGLEEWQLKDQFAQIKSFISKVSKALRIVALRTEIMGEPGGGRLGTVDLYAQIQVRGRSEVKIMAMRYLSTGQAFLEGTAAQHPDLPAGADVELVIFGFEDGVHDDPQFNIECRAKVLRVDPSSAPRGHGFLISVQPVDQVNRERLTSLVLRETWPGSGPARNA
jgi:hypothetical protein